MKKILFLAFAVLFCASNDMMAQKKDKEQKEKKVKPEFVWELPNPLSGDKTVDEYLLSCDTLWTKIQEYSNDLTKFKFEPAKPLKVGNKLYEVAYGTNSEGQIVTRGQVNWQLAETILQCTNILLDCTNIGLMTANATMALPGLGLKALSFGKYVKVGPKIIAKGTKELGEVVRVRKDNLRDWREIKKDALTAEQVDALVKANPDMFAGWDDAVVAKINKCAFIREVKDTEENYTTKCGQWDSMSDEEKNWASNLAQLELAPEDPTKTRSEEEFNELNLLEDQARLNANMSFFHYLMALR